MNERDLRTLLLDATEGLGDPSRAVDNAYHRARQIRRRRTAAGSLAAAAAVVTTGVVVSPRRGPDTPTTAQTLSATPSVPATVATAGRVRVEVLRTTCPDDYPDEWKSRCVRTTVNILAPDGHALESWSYWGGPDRSAPFAAQLTFPDGARARADAVRTGENRWVATFPEGVGLDAYDVVLYDAVGEPIIELTENRDPSVT